MRAVDPGNCYYGKVALLAALLAAFAAAALLWLQPQTMSDADKVSHADVLQRTIRYSVTVRNLTNKYLEDAAVSVYAPVAKTSFQKVSSIQASHAYELQSDSVGNQRLDFALDFPPFSTKVIAVTVALELNRSPVSSPLNDRHRHLQPARYLESDDPRVMSIAEGLSQGSSAESAVAISKWVSGHVEYAGYVKEDRGALYALTNERGDCTEYAYLFAALARAAELPSRVVGGFVVEDDRVLMARNFHNWSEVRVDESWRVADPQNDTSLEDEHTYIAMRVIEDVADAESGSRPNSHKIVYAGAGLQARMD